MRASKPRGDGMGAYHYIKVNIREGWFWIELPGTINLNNYKLIEHEVEQFLADKEMPRVVFDLDHLEYFYCSAMGLFIRLNKAIDGKGGKLCLVNVSQKVRELLASVNLDRVFPIFATDVEFEISDLAGDGATH
jgi:anti-anti-sigma factor